MKKTYLTVVLISLSAAVSFGGAITSNSATPGFTFTAVIGNSNVSGSDLTNTFVQVTFSDLSTASCSFGNGTGLCSSATNFSLAITPAGSQTNAATWTLSNLKAAGTWITTLDMNTLDSTPGMIGFDVGSVVGKTSGVGAGTSPASAAALLTDALHTSVQTPAQATEYARMILTFTTAAGVRLDGGQTFGFDASNHNITSAIADTPEPATYAMVGLALAGLGTLKLKRRKSLKKS